MSVDVIEEGPDAAQSQLAVVATTLTEMCTRLHALTRAAGAVNERMERGDLAGAEREACRLDALAESFNDSGLARALPARTGLLLGLCRRAAR